MSLPMFGVRQPDLGTSIKDKFEVGAVASGVGRNHRK